jgi:hypothetical protein
VFIDAIEPVEPPKQVVPSFVWLEFSEHPGQNRKPLLYFSLLDRVYKYIPFALYREPCFLEGDAALSCDTSNQMIQRGTELIKNLSGDYGDTRWWLLSPGDLEYLLPLSRIGLNSDFVRIGLKKGGNDLPDLRDVCIGPFNL